MNSLHSIFLGSGRFFFKVRNGLFPTLLILLLVVARPTRFLGHTGLDIYATALGIFLVLAGQTFRLLVIGYAYIRRGGKNREVFANELVTRGFYAHTRNPMYLGNFSVVVGLSLVYGSAWGYGLMVPFFAFVYLSITTAEEEYLHGKFGANFDEYVRRVNRFIPNLDGIRASLAEFSYDWRRALIKEYNTLSFILAAMFGILAWKITYVYGYAEHKTLIRALGATWIPLAVFYGTIRYLKKTRRLRPLRREETETDISPADQDLLKPRGMQDESSV